MRFGFNSFFWGLWINGNGTLVLEEILLRIAKRLRRFKSNADLTEANLAKIERDIFTGFFAMRKLFDSLGAVTDATKSSLVQLSYYTNLTEVTWINNHRIEDLYNLDRHHCETRDLKFVAGRIIHSFIYIPYTGEEGGLRGIFFTSGIDKNKNYTQYNRRCDRCL